MKKIGCVVLVGLLVLALLVGVWVMGAYNNLTRLQVAVDQAWSQVENVYQRRLDLVPNLVETVKGASNFERETLQAVTDARARASQITLSPEMLSDPAALQRFQAAQGELSGALSRLLATVENYPELKATEAYRDLMTQLEGSENRIAVERRRFNETVGTYNTATRVLPGSIVARLAGFTPRALFEAAEGAERAPAVRF